MATRAVYSFAGFPGLPERHLYLHHDGYPTGAAWRFTSALRVAPASDAFFNAFLSTQKRAEVLSSPAQAADAAYRYRILLVQAGPAQLLVQCWQRPPGGTWQPRCGPTPMDLFIRRFLPPAQQPSNTA